MNARWFLGLAVVGSWLLVPGVAPAATIIFDDLNGQPNVTGLDFEFGFTQSTVGNTTTFSGQFFSFDALTGSGGLYFTEQAGTITSDILTLQWDYDFEAAVETVSGTWQVGVSVPTPGGATTLPEGFSGDITDQFPGVPSAFTLFAETNPPGAAPEPASVALVVGGVLTLAGRQLVRRWKA